jgi:hypothetical protein
LSVSAAALWYAVALCSHGKVLRQLSSSSSRLTALAAELCEWGCKYSACAKKSGNDHLALHNDNYTGMLDVVFTGQLQTRRNKYKILETILRFLMENLED